jgi:hypothetical protein
VEQGVSQNNFVQSTECKIFYNKSMLIKIYIADSIDIRKERFDTEIGGGIKGIFLHAIIAYILATSLYPAVGDMTLQICNSTALQCTMHSDRSLISMSSNDIMSNQEQGRTFIRTLIRKMMTTMTPVVGSHLVHGKLVPYEAYPIW